MLGYTIAKQVENGARQLGATDSEATEAGLIAGSLATLGGAPSGLAYIGEKLVEESLGSEAGEHIRNAIEHFEIGERVGRLFK